MGLIGSLIIGAIAGIIAKAILGERYSFILTVIIGCIGGFLGGVLFGEKSGLIPQILVSAVGAIIFLAVLGLFKRGK
ncbi:MAG: GlsB/YeaQ/YmgE family stress response membrane protein [Sebaldella sp.]|nr:GlsB/YeaQ/YmgE family stress response membrane protein [Sebaldella sp.]